MLVVGDPARFARTKLKGARFELAPDTPAIRSRNQP
jgi:hypothetical protein